VSAANSELFQLLIVQLAQGAWVALGKIPNPISGKIERNLEAARLTIDMLDAVEVRTRGNLSDDEKAVLERSLRDLRLNYVDEQKKEAAPPEQTASVEETASKSEESAASPPPDTKSQA
jgi:hypothetical protein